MLLSLGAGQDFYVVPGRCQFRCGIVGRLPIGYDRYDRVVEVVNFSQVFLFMGWPGGTPGDSRTNLTRV